MVFRFVFLTILSVRFRSFEPLINHTFCIPFLGGPSSQHETIELRGFTDDERHGGKLKGKDLPPAREHKQPTTNGSLKGPFSDSKAVQQQQEDQQQCDEAGGLDLEKILKMDHIPGILPVCKNEFNTFYT